MRKYKVQPTKRSMAAVSDTIFFYMPADKPYGRFCQWHPSPIRIPTSSLVFLDALSSATQRPSALLTHFAEQQAQRQSADVEEQKQTQAQGLENSALHFSCAEQSYMFCKALFFGDETACTAILATPDPKTQKLIGKNVKGFEEEKWSEVKFRVAVVGNWYKFTHGLNECQYEPLRKGKDKESEKRDGMRDTLLGTGDKEIAEAGRRDRVWGIGYKAEEAERHRHHWGQNLLGKALMRVRERLRANLKEMQDGEWVEWDWDGGEEDVSEKEGAEGERVEAEGSMEG
ncbi:DUF1768-domain-containing protein [Lophiostoma macrostomum CBS 122681]|uniref:DUF1768-domain-containing protein n=1 Tax=Lophiostoma macrostomum CBS 122681 TaxID=1314788 RepID=A0A6A6T2C1_9PLEO|nr:DUF1768-domain-containing protein [Lophiostoma macrostomum CBS 122681]